MPNFMAYVRISDKHYRESFGLSFEEFQVGQKFKHRPGVTISQQDNKNEALESINYAQLHYDENYASQTEWKRCLVVSTLTLQNVLGATWKTFARKFRIIAYDDIAMTHPVFGGDTLYAESEILKKEEKDKDFGVVQVLTSGLNQKGAVVCKIQYQMLIYKKGKHPLDRDAMPLSEERFLAYRQVEESLMEQSGLYYEELEAGETYEHFHSRTFTEEESRHHALHSLEWNPLYIDAAYIKKFYHDKFYIDDAFLLGAISALTTKTFARVVANLQWKNLKLPIPVCAGDTIRCVSKILSKRESKSRPTQGIMAATTEAYNQHNELVCAYERHFLIYKKGLGPYETAGY